MESMRGQVSVEEVLPFVLKHIRIKDLLKIRLVNKTWNAIISTERFFDGFVFKVCDKLESIETFSNLSPSFQVKQFRFEHMDLENDLFVDADAFRRFSKNHCLNMTSLAIQNCAISTGRFYELLAFCKNLKKLTLRNVPNIYRVDNGIGIFHWAFCFKSVRENLSKVKSLLLFENTGLSHRDIWGLASGMTTLKHLLIYSDGSLPLPIQGITEVLKGCSETLKGLTLRGKIITPGLELGEDVKMKALRKLTLIRSSIDSSTVKQLQDFLTKCPKLETFHLQHSKIEKLTFSSVEKILTVLDLCGCDIDDNAFDEAEFENLENLRLQIATENAKLTCDENSGEVSLLKCKKPKLLKLELQLPSDGAAYLKFLDAQNYSALKSLTFTNSQDIAGRPLRKIFKEFKNLASFSIINCKELSDENLCCSDNNDAEESLTNLQNLKTLSLAGSAIGIKTIDHCIVKMKRLEFIHLDNTKVNGVDLLTLLCPVASKLTSLKTVTVKHLKISQEDLDKLAELAPTVKVECQALESCFT